MLSMKNEAEKDTKLFNFLVHNRDFSGTWNQKKSGNIKIQEILNNASKKNNGKRGEPDFLYVNETEKLLILIENKSDTNDHESIEKDNPTRFAVDGIYHYLKFFTNDYLKDQKNLVQNYFKGWKILGIAISGDISEKYNQRITTFIIKENQKESIINLNNNNILNEDEYLALFENIDFEEIISKISKSSNYINQLLRNTDSQKRPIILSSLMICLFDNNKIQNDFKDGFINWTNITIIENIPSTLELILEKENIPDDKIEILKNQFIFSIRDDIDISQGDLLKTILEELENNVIPLFKRNTNYDIIGKFYEDFLKYAGVTNVKNGIVLTPRHVTELFTELVELKYNDVIFDPTCGTGTFLIAGMNKILDLIDKSKMTDKEEMRDKIKEKHLLGFEKNPTMFALSISNMLFRGDGKSQIHQVDFFSKDANEIIKERKPTIGFINPPYGGEDQKKNPTKKEIQFLQKILDSCERYVVMIAPLSTYFKDDNLRNQILSRHTLKYVINMPSELFQPNASTHTAIAVFKTKTPHEDKDVLFYDLKDDGFVLSKQKGRTDVLNKWEKIKSTLLKNLDEPVNNIDDINFVKAKIKENDEWVIQAHSKTDYSKLKEEDFLLTVKEQIIFKVKKDLNLLDKDLNELELLEILNKSKIKGESFFDNKK